MNSFGRIFRVSLFGESHGPQVGVLVDGCPAGLPITVAELQAALERRRPAAAGTTARQEPDVPLIRSGVLEGRTTGAPILMAVENVDADPAAYERIKLTPRPGHADLAARAKFAGHNDQRGGGHLSGRLTAGIVMAGVLAGKIVAPAVARAAMLEAGGSADIDRTVRAAAADRDSVGAVIECRVAGLPAGLGEPFFDSVESMVSHLVFSLGGVRGIEFGAGFASARMRGSVCNDPILAVDGTTSTNHAGGVNGGITNGNELVFRVAVKPTSSIGLPQSTIDWNTGAPATLSIEGRHDACHALRMPVIVESAAAIVLADLMMIQRGVGWWTEPRAQGQMLLTCDEPTLAPICTSPPA
jgi:chorismate synthase